MLNQMTKQPVTAIFDDREYSFALIDQDVKGRLSKACEDAATRNIAARMEADDAAAFELQADHKIGQRINEYEYGSPVYARWFMTPEGFATHVYVLMVAAGNQVSKTTIRKWCKDRVAGKILGETITRCDEASSPPKPPSPTPDEMGEGSGI